jgi:SAM-dependent methyltransferase
MPFTKELAQPGRTAVGVDLATFASDHGSALGCRADLHALPFPDAVFDVVISMSVVEHLANPEQAFREFGRVLRPGGILVIQTPNLYDYVSIVSALSPYRFHRWLMSRILDRQEEDVFPVLYRANTRRALRQALLRSGFTVDRIVLFNQYPAYLMFSTWIFRLGILYERITSRFEWLAPLRGWLLAEARRTSTLPETPLAGPSPPPAPTPQPPR